MTEELTGEDRCWPCTLANLAVGGLIGGGPLWLVWGQASPLQMGLAGGWAVAVVVFTLYRVVERGYLPGAERIARRTGLHDRIGPGSESRQEGRESDR